jgi:hypothetical protein
MPITPEVLKKYLSESFVETGSYIGSGIEAALEAGFKSIYSIELSDKYFDYCASKFSDRKEVQIIKGDSGLMLYDAVKDIDHRITFWLDGHHSCGDTALGSAWCPLMLELDLIAKHPIKEHTIIIDDMRCWDKGNPVIGFGEEQIREKLLSINSSYKFFYEFGTCEKDILISVVL